MSDDEDDLFGALGLTERAGASASESVCEHCGASGLAKDDAGYLVCTVCGTQSQDVRQLTQEEMDGDIVRFRRGGIYLRRQRKQRDNTSTLLPEDLFTTADYFHALQIILQAYVHVLVEECGAPAGLEDIVRHAWFRYVAKWTHYPSVPVHVIDGHARMGLEKRYLAKLRADGDVPAPVLPPTLELVAACCCVGLRWTCAPLMPHDVARWLRSGVLPYRDALLLLPHDLRISMYAAWDVLTPRTVPSGIRLARYTTMFARHIGLPLPEANILPCALRLINRCHLPAALAVLVRDIYSLDTMDRVTENAYTKGQLRGASFAVETWSLIGMRKRLDRSSAAYVAALVCTAMRCMKGWREWVGAHLAPGGEPTDAQAAARHAAALGSCWSHPFRECCVVPHEAVAVRDAATGEERVFTAGDALKRVAPVLGGLETESDRPGHPDCLRDVSVDMGRADESTAPGGRRAIGVSKQTTISITDDLSMDDSARLGALADSAGTLGDSRVDGDSLAAFISGRPTHPAPTPQTDRLARSRSRLARSTSGLAAVDPSESGGPALPTIDVPVRITHRIATAASAVLERPEAGARARRPVPDAAAAVASMRRRRRTLSGASADFTSGDELAAGVAHRKRSRSKSFIHEGDPGQLPLVRSVAASEIAARSTNFGPLQTERSRRAYEIQRTTIWDDLPVLAPQPMHLAALMEMLANAIDDAPGHIQAHMEVLQVVLQLYTPLPLSKYKQKKAGAQAAATHPPG